MQNGKWILDPAGNDFFLHPGGNSLAAVVAILGAGLFLSFANLLFTPTIYLPNVFLG